MSKLASGLAGNLAKLTLGVSAWMLFAISSASAQYYPPGNYGGPPPAYYRSGPPPAYYRSGPPPAYYRSGPPPAYYRSGPPPRYGDGYARQRMGSVCVTSRGSCPQRNYSPIGANCTCIIPGFGRKRGGIEY